MSGVNATGHGVHEVIIIGPSGATPKIQGDASGTPIPVSQPGTDVVVASGGAAGQYFVTLPAVAGKTLYLAGFVLTGTGATAASAPYVALTGTAAGGTLYFSFAVPAGAAAAAIVPLVVQFTRPLPASAANTAIVVNVPSFGAGNTLSSCFAHGFYL